MEDTVAADAEIEDTGFGGSGEHSRGEGARPAPVGLRRRCGSVRDRVAECDNRADIRRRRDIDAVNPVPRPLGAGVTQVGCTREVPRL